MDITPDFAKNVLPPLEHKLLVTSESICEALKLVYIALTNLQKDSISANWSGSI
jgi:hypothetical protein